MHIQGGSQRKAEKGNQRQYGAAEELANFRIKIPQDDSDTEWQYGAEQSLPREAGESSDSKGHHGKEWARFKRHRGICGGFFGGPILSHQSHVQASVGVVERGHHS